MLPHFGDPSLLDFSALCFSKQFLIIVYDTVVNRLIGIFAVLHLKVHEILCIEQR